MREIKFRIWNLKQHRIFSWQEVCDAKNALIFTWINYQVNSDFNILMQFTGLLDKNGKESYHKDYIRDILTGAEFIIEYGKYSFRTGTGYGWYLQGLQVESIPMPLNLEGYEIFGNTLENPQLIEHLDKENE
jgi:hypothetical protein